jgi:hypothetical protein
MSSLTAPNWIISKGYLLFFSAISGFKLESVKELGF